MKEKLIKSLTTHELPEYEYKYILAVVEYIDNNMCMLKSQEINFAIITKRMLELVQTINNCNTGVDIIDNIVNSRKQNAYENIDYLGQSVQEFIDSRDYRTSAYEYIQNYIAIISNYGGLYKYICEQYKLDIERIDSIQKKKLIIKV